MYAIGLMSGTSLDGIDAALIKISRIESRRYHHELIDFQCTPYPSRLRRELTEVIRGKRGDAGFFSCLNMEVGFVFGEAGRALMLRNDLKATQVSVIGFHGQTIWYEALVTAQNREARDPHNGDSHLRPQREILPLGTEVTVPIMREGEGPLPHDFKQLQALSPSQTFRASTWQIGDPALVAAVTGVPTIGDFRASDIANGGLGAPLTPWFHYHAFSDPNVTRAVNNLGGISNVTLLPAGGTPSEVVAFDTGPANMLIDRAVRKVSRGKRNFDRNGEMAQEGKVCEQLVEEWLRHPYFEEAPPKATGNSLLGESYFSDIFEQAKKYSLTDRDFIATVTAFSADSVVLSYERFILPHYSVDEVILSGGGVQNATFFSRIEKGLKSAGIPVVRALPRRESDSLEAVAFALMAAAASEGEVNSLPQVTGAGSPMILGSRVLPPGVVLRN